MIVVNTNLPKLCHAKPGDVVRITNPQTGELTPAIYIVAVVNVSGKRAARPFMPHGLYDEQRPLFLVDIETGEAVPMPHLSSRVEIVKDIAVVEGYGK